jgi:hypothetical protein
LTAAEAASSESTAAAEPAAADAGAPSAAAPAEPLRLSIAWNEKSAHCQSTKSQESSVHRHPHIR